LSDGVAGRFDFCMNPIRFVSAADTISDMRIPDILHSDSKYVPTDPFFKLYEIIDQHLELSFPIRWDSLCRSTIMMY
jgi:hypothetical protein